ncbi:transcription initiation factor TFIID subunit 8 [Nymphaea colorata]|uniref:Transcription initiation factor TFIID subunit 8 n=1 Tax=Nymphaea colorata TaxID=210225 RepID=A0A5K1EXT0_9MAGN|nr:transcription initiation factor TFIID subunit 8 [Nymphaea colorata]VVW56015.1 unnamed protein product [Nymphaea colorata]
MTDGGGPSGRVRCLGDSACSSGRGDFARAVAQISVAQICESVGYQAFRQSALESLADISIRYIQDLGRSASFHANSAGRTESNVFDVIRALKELHCSVGFSDVSESSGCSLSASGLIKEIMQYASLAEEIPFVRAVPRFPIIRECRLAPNFLRIGEAPPGAHIPSWLPAFPDSHTYRSTPVWNERATDPRTDKIEQSRQRRKAERSLVNLQQRLMCNGTATTAFSLVDGDFGVRGKHKEEKRIENTAFGLVDGDFGIRGKPKDVKQIENPFLAPPLPFGEKEVSHVTLLPRLSDHSNVDGQPSLPSVVETFRPAIEAAKYGLGTSSGNGGPTDEQVLPSDRPAVNFKLGSPKNVSGSSMGMNVKNLQNSGKNSHWFPRDEDKDDKKRRAEQILKEAIENPQELAQL